MTKPPSAIKKSITSNNYIVLQNINVQFNSVTALHNANLSIGSGEVIGLLGENGAGKTTLINVLNGIVVPESGDIFIDGQQVEEMTPESAQSAGIETVYQEPRLIDSLSSVRNFFLGHELKKTVGPVPFFDYRGMERIAAEAIRSFGFTLNTPLRQPVRYLSRRERQINAISRARYFARKLLVLDEPTLSLSESEVDIVLNMIRQARYEGLSVLFLTYKAQEVFSVADRFVILHRGENYIEKDKRKTDYKELEKLLVASRFTAVRQMAAAVAHQIRNPLGILRVSAEMLHSDFQVPEKQKANYHHLTEMLVDEINTLNLVINNFLDFTRQKEPNRSFCSIPDLIDSSLTTIPLDRFPGREIKVDVAAGLPEYPLDRRLMEQVISNLVMNALEASPENSCIDVRADMRHNHLAITIRDHGEGMDEDVQRQIFNPFFSTKATGTGLGLAIVQRIVHQHDGKIEVKSTAGKGTEFAILL
jgi:simple sugar transport system ATP-binding protein